MVLAQRIAFIGIAFLAAWFLAPGRGLLHESILDMWNRLDAARFVGVAEHGYTDPSDPNAAAFFPLLPFLLGGAKRIGIDPVLAGMLINTVATFVAFLYLFRLVDEEYDGETAHRALLYLAFFPTAVFLVAPYSEALFIAGGIAAFYYARRGRWHLVGLPAGVACAARFAGVFLLFGLLVEFLAQRDFRRQRIATAAVSLLTGLLPFAFYTIYLWRISGDAWLFFHAQRAGWGRAFVGPVRSFFTTLHTWTGPEFFTNQLIAWRVEIAAAALGVALVVWAVLKREWGYAAYMGSMHGALITSSWYYSIPRAMLTMFPAVIFLAAHTKTRPRRHEIVLIAFSCVAIFGVIVYTRDHWFF